MKAILAGTYEQFRSYYYLNSIIPNLAIKLDLIYVNDSTSLFGYYFDSAEIVGDFWLRPDAKELINALRQHWQYNVKWPFSESDGYTNPNNIPITYTPDEVLEILKSIL